uniref:hypothetical protein n=1 Tax=Promineifilum sp. TaxID=2664178 RepID=UPI0035AD9C54
AFDLMPNGSILMSLDAAQNVPGLGQVTPQDIIRFAPTSLGANTAGSFLWFLDGSDVGLTTAGEKIDAIIIRVDVQQPLLISLSGAGSAPRQSGGNLTIADEDLINFVGVTYGANSAGAWRMNTDGSTVPGMAGEDLFAAEWLARVPARLSRQLFGFDSAFVINGVKGTPRDVLYADDGLAVKNLTTKPIDAIAIGPAR